MKKEGKEEGERDRVSEQWREEGEVNIVHTQLCADTFC